MSTKAKRGAVGWMAERARLRPNADFLSQPSTIGAKSLATLLLLAVGLVAGGYFGVLSPERLAQRDTGALLLAGVFAVVTGTLAYRFFRLGEKSRQFFGWSSDSFTWEDEAHFVGGKKRRVTLGVNHGEAFDLPAAAQLGICVTVLLIAALGAVDSRAWARLSRAASGVSVGSYCPDLASRPAEIDPNAPGCALVRRAYMLGYAKDLGECGVAQTRAVNRAVCTLRQRDEPIAHYAWRLLVGFWDNVSSALQPERFARVWKESAARFEQLENIRGTQRQVLAAAPHAAHHVWTNLPDPGTGAFSALNCEERYRFLPQRPAENATASQVFEHVLAQLLFDSRYQAPAGTCREYTVHWNAPEDACEQLAKDAFGFLHGQGALASVLSVLERWKLGKAQRALQPAEFLSFQCYMERAGATARASREFFIGEHAFAAQDVRVAAASAALSTDRYDAVAQLLARGFHYGKLLSEEGIERDDVGALKETLAGGDFALSRLYGLESLDIFLDPAWLGTRADLLEVYPYQMHLRNFVRVFRRQYEQERGRL